MKRGSGPSFKIPGCERCEAIVRELKELRDAEGAAIFARRYMGWGDLQRSRVARGGGRAAPVHHATFQGRADSDRQVPVKG